LAALVGASSVEDSNNWWTPKHFVVFGGSLGFPLSPRAGICTIDPTDLGGYMRQSHDILHSKAALPEYIMLAPAETGLYQTLHRLGVRVHTSRIVRRYL